MYGFRPLSPFRMFAGRRRVRQVISIVFDELFRIDDVWLPPRLLFHAIHEMAGAPQSIAVYAIPNGNELHRAVGACELQQAIIALGVGGVRSW
jgi:hypothetical protein